MIYFHSQLGISGSITVSICFMYSLSIVEHSLSCVSFFIVLHVRNLFSIHFDDQIHMVINMICSTIVCLFCYIGGDQIRDLA